MSANDSSFSAHMFNMSSIDSQSSSMSDGYRVVDLDTQEFVYNQMSDSANNRSTDVGQTHHGNELNYSLAVNGYAQWNGIRSANVRFHRNRCERNRHTRISNLIKVLKQKVPNGHPHMSTVQALRSAAEYIREMTSLLNQTIHNSSSKEKQSFQANQNTNRIKRQPQSNVSSVPWAVPSLLNEQNVISSAFGTVFSQPIELCATSRQIWPQSNSNGSNVPWAVPSRPNELCATSSQIWSQSNASSVPGDVLHQPIGLNVISKHIQPQSNISSIYEPVFNQTISPNAISNSIQQPSQSQILDVQNLSVYLGPASNVTQQLSK